jgi:hypothetical protein
MQRRTRKLTIAAVLVATGLGAAQAASSSTAPRPDWHLNGPVYAHVAAPHVMPQATGLTGEKTLVVPDKSGPTRVSVPWNIDGCDHDYGTANVCVPWAVPGSTTAARCDWLLKQGFAPFAVFGKDRQDLNPARTSLACSAADLAAGAK